MKNSTATWKTALRPNRSPSLPTIAVDDGRRPADSWSPPRTGGRRRRGRRRRSAARSRRSSGPARRAACRAARRRRPDCGAADRSSRCWIPDPRESPSCRTRHASNLPRRNRRSAGVWSAVLQRSCGRTDAGRRRGGASRLVVCRRPGDALRGVELPRRACPSARAGSRDSRCASPRRRGSSRRGSRVVASSFSRHMTMPGFSRAITSYSIARSASNCSRNVCPTRNENNR